MKFHHYLLLPALFLSPTNESASAALARPSVLFIAYRKDTAKWLQSRVAKSRQDLALPSLKWHVSQQPPTDEKGLNAIDVTANLAALAADPAFIHLKAFNLPPQEEKLVITTAGIVQLGELLAQSYREHK